MFESLLAALPVWLPPQIALPMLASLGTGLLIGLDREVMGKPAGLRTHALVALAATVVTLAGAHQDLWSLSLVPGTQIVSDPTRMAHGILTGIGFLGAGVIFRQGPSVQGLTTAASLWITAALGVVYGVGMFGLALAGSFATLLVLVGLRVLAVVVPHQQAVRLSVVVDAKSALDGVWLERTLGTYGLSAAGISHRFDASAGTVSLSTKATGRQPQVVDRLAAELRAHPDVRSFSLRTQKDAEGQETGH